MKWMLITLAYSVTGADVPRQIQFYDQEFATEDLCDAARLAVQSDLRTRDVDVKATCVQISE